MATWTVRHVWTSTSPEHPAWLKRVRLLWLSEVLPMALYSYVSAVIQITPMSVTRVCQKALKDATSWGKLNKAATVRPQSSNRKVGQGCRNADQCKTAKCTQRVWLMTLLLKSRFVRINQEQNILKIFWSASKALFVE